ncbi:hypothetical protein N7456_004598 [Penicillium angulare]|uniref:Fe2OG dioxygenase domain-containing protein n=1 Tax=Penicillium angulare TaxID=116970 RepID=A0A9W9KJQ8_9EURO|nr:hypothetical protein N7456_004598 [Penicillium angulare]
MSTKEGLPLINLAAKQSSSTISSTQNALRQFGAFRFVAPQLTQNRLQRVFQNARGFFQLPIELKLRTKSYSAFDTELIRGKRAVPKESIYFFRKAEGDYHPPPSELQDSVETLHQEWTNFRSQLFSTLSIILDSTEPLEGTPTLDFESLGVNFYDSDKLDCDRAYFNPAHMDGGTLTILARATEAHDGLEIADLTTTEKLDSEGIGLDASFISVPAISGEVIVLAGTRLQRIFGKDKVRACVHRVCNPVHMSNNSAVKERLSLAIFCAPPFK